MAKKSKEQKSAENNEEKFLAELTELSKKYELVIGGCGCCGSPYVYPMTPKQAQRGGYDNSGSCLEYK